MHVVQLRSAQLHVALQNVSNIRWDSITLTHKVREHPQTSILLRVEQYPYWKTIVYTPHRVVYHIRLPRAQCVENRKFARVIAQVQANVLVHPDELELIRFINWLRYSTPQ
jgi:hypothetical protein